jgi:hypothetical protein
MRHSLYLAALAGALAVQVPGQVSMSVTSSIGTVGYACEAFQCLPNQTLAGLGENLTVEIFGMTNMPYVLAIGMPSPFCQTITGIGGEFALAFPVFTLEIGVIVSRMPVGLCNTSPAVTSLGVANYLPLGMQFRLQALAVGANGMAFTRAVEVHTR